MSQIDFSKLRGLTARKLIRVLKKDGFVIERKSGAHQQYRHLDGRQVTISYHKSSDTFRRSIIEIQACWTETDLRRLKVVK